jgi:N-acetyl sugar amidotransferase
MNRSRLCVIPDTRPDTAFVDGVCSACISYERRKEVDWIAREGELMRILETTPRNGSGYDCIVPSSGGKDSTWQVLKLIRIGVRPLVVTATTCHLTSVGRRNIDNLARYATTIEVSPNKEVRAKLNKLGLELVGDISWPEHVSIFTTPFKVALQTGIPLLFYGESPQEAYGGPLGADEAKEMTRRWVSEFGGFLGLRPDDLMGHEGLKADDLIDYTAPNADAIAKLGVRAYFLGQFYEWDSARNARIAIENGMQTYRGLVPGPANYWFAENLDNAQTGLHDHLMYRKYGYGRVCAQVSVDVRKGVHSRARAIEYVRTLDGKFPDVYMGVDVKTMLKRIGMTMEELDIVLERFTNKELFAYEENRRPILREFA